MLIECTQKQDGGRIHTIDDVEYKFLYDADLDAQVAEVTDEAHIERFLSITEAFKKIEVETEEVVIPKRTRKNKTQEAEQQQPVEEKANEAPTQTAE